MIDVESIDHPLRLAMTHQHDFHVAEDSEGLGFRPGDSVSPVDYRPDWYPDPTRRFEFRYYNGIDWTGDVAVDGNRFLDPLPRIASETNSSSPWNQPFVATGQYVAQVPRSQGSTRPATAALVLGISSVAVGWVPYLFVLAAVAAVLALVFGLPALARAKDQRPPNERARGFALAGVILAPIGLATCGIGLWLSVVVYREVEEFTEVGQYSVEITTCTVGEGVARLDGTIKNQSDTTRSYRVTLDFVRPDTDNTLYREAIDIEDVGPGDSQSWTVEQAVDEEQLGCEVASVTGPVPFGPS